MIEGRRRHDPAAQLGPHDYLVGAGPLAVTHVGVGGEFDDGVDVGVETLDGQRRQHGLGVPGAVVQRPVSDDDGGRGGLDAGPLQVLFGHLAPHEMEPVVGDRLRVDVRHEHDVGVGGARVGPQVGEYLLHPAVPAAEDDVIPERGVRVHAPVLPHALLDEHAGDGGGEHAEHADPEEHQHHADQPAAGRHGRDVAEAHGGQGDHRPPERVGQRPALEEHESDGPAQDQHRDDRGQPEQVLAAQEAEKPPQRMHDRRREVHHGRMTAVSANRRFPGGVRSPAASRSTGSVRSASRRRDKSRPR